MAQTDLRKYGTEERLGKMDLDVISITPTCDADATGNNEVIFDFFEIPYAGSVPGGSCLLHSIQLLDGDHHAGKIDLVFATASTTLGSTTISLSDADAQNILGYTTIEDYFDGVAFEMATVTNLGLAMKCASGTTSLYVAGVNRSGGSLNYTTDKLHLKLGIVKD